jgi:hypothetical protein
MNIQYLNIIRPITLSVRPTRPFQSSLMFVRAYLSEAPYRRPPLRWEPGLAKLTLDDAGKACQERTL